MDKKSCDGIWSLGQCHQHAGISWHHCLFDPKETRQRGGVRTSLWSLIPRGQPLFSISISETTYWLSWDEFGGTKISVPLELGHCCGLQPYFYRFMAIKTDKFRVIYSLICLSKTPQYVKNMIPFQRSYNYLVGDVEAIFSFLLSKSTALSLPWNFPENIDVLSIFIQWFTSNCVNWLFFQNYTKSMFLSNSLVPRWNFQLIVTKHTKKNPVYCHREVVCDLLRNNRNAVLMS